jgi:uncharacterized protein DUF2255
MQGFDEPVLDRVAKQREVELTTFGRLSGREHRRVLWASTDGRRVFVRSGQGLTRDWPKNLIAAGTGILHLEGHDVRVRGRLLEEPEEARAVSRLHRAKYGDYVKPSSSDEPLTPGEQASFELVPA